MMQYITDPFVMTPVGLAVAATGWLVGSYSLWRAGRPILSRLTAMAGGASAGLGVFVAVIGRYFI